MTLRRITVDDVRQAAGGLAGTAHRTPVLTSRILNDAVGASLFFKCENLQRGGAFKFRGAYTALRRLAKCKDVRGVLTYSSGNHAQATALTARILNIPAVVMMPHDATPSKVAATIEYGAEVIRYHRHTTDRELLAAELAGDRGLALVPPYDDPDVIAGQGTVALELIDEVGSLDAIIVSLGGGGLLAGTALSARELLPRIDVYGIEPMAGNDGQQSLKAGRIVRIPPPVALPEGALATHLGELNFDIIRRNVTAIETVTDPEIVAAMRVFLTRMKLLVEPTGALPLAALLSGKLAVRGKRVGVIVSGGNVDPDRLALLLRERFAEHDFPEVAHRLAN